MKSRNIVFALLLIILIVVSNFDKTYQINEAFQSMLIGTEDEEILSKLDGSGLERLLKLYREENYNKPQLSIVRNNKEEAIVCITVIKYGNNDQAYGNVIASDSTYFRFVFERIPILNIDILERVIPEA